MRGPGLLGSGWDNSGDPRQPRQSTMTTSIKQADLVESIAAALQYIS